MRRPTPPSGGCTAPRSGPTVRSGSRSCVGPVSPHVPPCWCRRASPQWWQSVGPKGETRAGRTLPYGSRYRHRHRGGRWPGRPRRLVPSSPLGRRSSDRPHSPRRTGHPLSTSPSVGSKRGLPRSDGNWNGMASATGAEAAGGTVAEGAGNGDPRSSLPCRSEVRPTSPNHHRTPPSGCRIRAAGLHRGQGSRPRRIRRGRCRLRP